MAVRIVIGRAGSGKTLRCFDGVVAALRADPLGPPVYWIVPKQATFMTERRLVCAVGGFCRAKVLSFESLGEEILEECGGAAVPEITGLGRQMVLGHLLRKFQGSAREDMASVDGRARAREDMLTPAGNRFGHDEDRSAAGEGMPPENATRRAEAGERLRYFSRAARQPGLAAKLDATFAEFERNGRGSEDLGELLHSLSLIVERSGEQRALFDKVHDLKLIYDAYTAYLGQDRLDRHRRLAQVLSCMKESRRFAGARVYVDGFSSFTEYERQVLAQLGKVCADVEVMLLMDPASPLLGDVHLLPAEMSWFYSMERTYRQLCFTLREAKAPVDETVVLGQVYRFTSPALGVVEKELQWRLSISRIKPEGIELIEAADRRSEVDAVARRIRGLWREGVRLREMSVLVRDLDVYHDLIAASFREHEIEFFADRRRQVGHHPLLQFVRACLAIAQTAWPHDAVMTVIKSGLSGLADEDADDLENYVLEHRVRGAAWTAAEAWNYAREWLAPEDEHAAESLPVDRIDRLRWELVGRLTPFIEKVSGAGLTLKQIVLRVFELLEGFGVQERIVKWMEEAHAQGRLEQRDEHAQVWKGMVELLDQMVELMGDEPATLADFVEIYETGMEQFELAITPPTTDEVIVGQIDRTRSPELRVVFVLGMNEGVFPKMKGEDSVLSDVERRELAARNLEIDPDTQRKLLDENLLAYIALTRASEKLIVTRALADAGGRPLAASVYWRRLRELFPKLEPVVIGESGGVEAIGTPRQLVVSLMRWVRGLDDAVKDQRQKDGRQECPPHHPGSEKEIPPHQDGMDGTFAALYQWLATHPVTGDAIDVMRFRAWKALSYANGARLSKEVAKELFASPLVASVTRIESFAACPFKHFARYGLGLREREDDEAVSSLDLGNVFHHVLEEIVGGMVAEKKKWQDVPAAQRNEMIHSVAQEVGKQLRGEIMLSSARNRYLLGRIEQTLEEVTAGQEAAARRGQFVPAFAELTFGGAKGKLPGLEVTTPGGRKVVLQGKIDRVDVIAGEAAFAVIDYKLHGNRLMLDRVYHGLSLQLLTYLLVLRENGEKLMGRKMTPAAAFYVKLLRQLDEVKHPDDVLAEDAAPVDLRVKPRGIFEESCLPALDDQCVKGYSQVVNAYVKGDGTLGNRGTTDVAEAEEFAGLIEYVRRRVGELGDLILEGRIDVHPYQIQGISPCPNCEFRAVCRFDPAINRYKHLEPMGREMVLQKVLEGGNP